MFGSNKKAEDNLAQEDSTLENSDQNLGELLRNASEEDETHISQTNSPKYLKPSIISEGFEFNGDLKSTGALTVDGAINGNISVDSLTIGVNGSVGGTIMAKLINVKGKLSGTVSCSEIIVGGRSVVDANLTYSSITIQRGGVVKGDLRKG